MALGAWADSIAELSAGRAAVDPIDCLVERSRLEGWSRSGRQSCGGASRILRAHDDWVCLSLAREDDWELLPALFRVREVPDWDAVAELVSTRTTSEILSRAILLGLPVARLGEVGPDTDPIGVTGRRAGREPVQLGDVSVVDLSSLWAGPLATSILVEAGATVVKIESTSRPDGARRGNREFFDRLNAHKEQVSIDFGSPSGRRELAELVGGADVVVTASRARALEQLGLVGGGDTPTRPQIRLNITGHPDQNRVAFGDDAAVAAGLICWAGDEPCFLGDAVADPLTGLAAAAELLRLLAEGFAGQLTMAMSAVAASTLGSSPAE